MSTNEIKPIMSMRLIFINRGIVAEREIYCKGKDAPTIIGSIQRNLTRDINCRRYQGGGELFTGHRSLSRNMESFNNAVLRLVAEKSIVPQILFHLWDRLMPEK
jgi:hypothetical protein